MDKKSLRNEINAALAGCSARQLSDWSAAITGRLVGLDAYRLAGVVMVFLSMPGEYETGQLIGQALADGKTVAVPRVNFADKSMMAVKVSSLGQEMVTDRYGLRCPADNIEVDINEIDLIIVPGLAFDGQCQRLGRGGGFYDRFLGRPEVKRAVRCGVGFEIQMARSVPTDERDVVMDMVVTPLRVMSSK